MGNLRIAKEHIWAVGDDGVERLVVPKGHPVPEGVDVPASKTTTRNAAPAEEEPERKGRKPSANKARQSADDKSE